MHNPVWSARAEFHLLRGVTQNLGILPVGLARNTRTIHTHLFLLLPYKALRSDPCLANTA
jgi:hypothetical protein